jgi:DNA-binding PadR family transcriptional regulator
MSTTRLLILGALRFMQPAHGYAVREELESWDADKWANIAYGSIYHALNKMADEGLVRAGDAESVDNRPARTTYVITDQGEQEFQRLLHDYWWNFRSPIDPFFPAMSFMTELPEEDMMSALLERRSAVDGELRRYEGLIEQFSIGKPPHVVLQGKLWIARLEAELRWLDEVIDLVLSGEFTRANERWFPDYIAAIQRGELPMPEEEWSRRQLEEMGIHPPVPATP